MTIPKNAIRRRFEVTDGSRTAIHGGGSATEPIGGAGGNLLFIGMPGSGRRALAQAAALRLGLVYAEAPAAAHGGATTAAAAQETPGAAVIDELLSGSGRSIAILGADLGDPGMRERLRAAGKVFYLMSLPHILAARLGDLSRLEELALAVAENEPFHLQTAHFVLPIDATPEEMAEDVAMKALL